MDPPIMETPDDELATFCEIAAACCQHEPLKRPRMREVSEVQHNMEEAIIDVFRYP